ncbi:hypothetical protein AAFF_G00106400 [Aldrovandia affinis]|uniref:Uncharacterized protein n=1 Tax=Aldrovandia affinis TaxID=143900 RepID=A0AAD7T301_9TELE|nr:hypothetical protein AAFF_G00106400 [Aldrovandia affinis]
MLQSPGCVAVVLLSFENVEALRVKAEGKPKPPIKLLQRVGCLASHRALPEARAMADVTREH